MLPIAAMQHFLRGRDLSITQSHVLSLLRIGSQKVGTMVGCKTSLGALIPFIHRAAARWSLRRSPGWWSRPPLCPSPYPPQSVAACLPRLARQSSPPMGSESRETIYGGSVRAAVERATDARKQADRLACEAWTKRMLAFQGPAQPSQTLGDALNAGYGYLEVRCLGCDTNQTVTLDIMRRPKATPIHDLGRYMRCKEARRMSFSRSASHIRVASNFDSIRGSHISKIYKAFQFTIRVAHHCVSKILGESTPRWTSL